MSSLWTPGGEHRVPRTGDEPSGSGQPQPAGGTGRTGAADGGEPARTPDHRGGTAVEGEDDRELDEEMRQIAEQLLSTPAADVIANHCYGMFELAALHLGAKPPQLVEARLAIDALGAVVDTLGPRLGESAPTLREGLASIRLAFVQIASASGPGAESGPGGEIPG